VTGSGPAQELPLPPNSSTGKTVNGKLVPRYIATGDGKEPVGGSDSQLIRLADGSLLLLWTGLTYDEVDIDDAKPGVQHPTWWNTWANPAAKRHDTPFDPDGSEATRDGNRQALVLWRADHCDSNGLPVWNEPTALDAGNVLATDTNGKPVKGYCGASAGWEGGLDRHEFYADPWGVTGSGQRIYISTRCMRTDSDQAEVFVSEDSGKSWNSGGFPGLPFPAALPIVMTTTPSGRLFMAQCVGAPGAVKPFVYWSDDHGKSVVQPVDANRRPKGIDATFQSDTGPKLCSGLGLSDLSAVGNTNGQGPSIARHGEGVLLTYPSVDAGRQTFPVVSLTPDSFGNAAKIPVLTITAASNTGSVLFVTFVQDDRQQVQGQRPTMIFWIESDRPMNEKGVQLYAKYRLVGEAAGTSKNWTAPKLLSDPNGWQAVPSTLGEYNTGGFFFYKDQSHFLAAWAQNGQIVARIVSVGEPVTSSEPEPNPSGGLKVLPIPIPPPPHQPLEPRDRDAGPVPGLPVRLNEH
jgi:hypothetical protein